MSGGNEPKIEMIPTGPFDIGGDVMCTTCGKDVYKSSTGCLCGPGEANHVKGSGGSYGHQPELAKGDDGEVEILCPSCGKKRDRAAMDQTRVMPCDCGADAADAIDLINKQKK